MRYLLLILLFPMILFCQPSQQGNLKKLDPKLISVLRPEDRQAYRTMFPVPLVKPAGKRHDGKNVYGVIIYTQKPEALRAAGINPISILPGFVTARVTADELIKLTTLKEVSHIDAGRKNYPHNDVSKGLVGADLLHSGYINYTPYKGSGIIIGLIDTGIDWKHFDFRNPSDTTKSRILYIWDQTLTPQGLEVSPSGFTYGVEYTQAQINDELDGSPANFVRERDLKGHGTSVAGIAAGNGAASSTRKYGGIAPETDLIIVKAGEGFFEDVNVIDAISYMKNKAIQLGKPAVLNLSMGSNSGAHDGTDPVFVQMDDFSGNGRVIANSAGNDGNHPIHNSFTLSANGSLGVNVTVPSYTPTPDTANDYFYYDVWFQDSSRIDVTVTSPNGISITQNAGGFINTSTADGNIYIENQISPDNNDREILIYVYDSDVTKPPASGSWTVSFSNHTSLPVTFHGWLAEYRMGGTQVTISSGNSDYTLGCTAFSPIIVGSYVSKWRWEGSDGVIYWGGSPDRSDDIAASSSKGPTRDERIKPDITAPGQYICTAMSSSTSPGIFYILPGGPYALFWGTSASAPQVAGSAALLLQRDNSASYDKIRSVITSTSQWDKYITGSQPNNLWGWGKLDVFKAMTKLYDQGSNYGRDVLFHDDWNSTQVLNVSPGTKFAVKFYPNTTGKVSGCFFHTDHVTSLTSPLTFEIWSSTSNGFPLSKLGNSVTIDPDKIADGAWNFLNLESANVNVSRLQTFFIVMYFTSGSASFLCDNGNVDGFSYQDYGSGWTTYPNDVRIRAVVAADVSALPVELISFNSTIKNNNVILHWSTATEVNSYVFEIECMKLSKPGDKNNGIWQKIGELKACGNCNSPRDYSFEIKDLLSGSYNYRLKMTDLDGSYKYSETISVDIGKPNYTGLEQNFPNPFNPATRINYSIASDSHVKLRVFNVLGEVAATLTDEVKHAGRYTVEFDGRTLAAGVYFYRLEAGQFSQVRKLLIMK